MTHTETHHNQNVERQRQSGDLERNKRKMIHHIQRILLILTADFSSETLEPRRQWMSSEVLKEKNLATKNSLSGKTHSFKMKVEVTFPDNEKLRKMLPPELLYKK